MCRLEIPSLAVREEMRARLEADPSTIVMTEQGVARGWRAICFAFSMGVAMGWLWRL